MALVSYSIPNLSNGVSQQPAPLRLPTSCEEMVNGWPSVLSGLQKRPPSEHIANLGATSPTNAAGHLIRRDEGEYQFIVLATTTGLRVFSLDGTEQTVNAPNGYAYLSSAFNPVSDLRFMTFGDFTFIVNKQVTVRTTKYGEAGPSAVVPTTGSVNTFADLPASPTLGNTYYVVSEDAYYRYESVSATPAVVSWEAYTDWQSALPAGATEVADLPATVVVGQKVALSYVASTGIGGTFPGGSFYYPPVTQYRGYIGTVTTAAGPSTDQWVRKEIRDLAASTSGRLDPSSYATIFVREANANTNYNIYVGGILKATYLTPVGTDAATSVPDTAAIAEQLRADLATSGYTVQRIGSTISISGLNPATEVYASSTRGDTSMRAFRASVDSFSDLPPNEIEHRIVKVSGDPARDGDDYYVEYIDGEWVECLGWNAAENYKGATMPHVLIRESSGTWTFKPHTWKPRIVGDDATNGQPAFVDRKINDIFVYSNRLGFLSDENVVLSEANEFENFFRTTVAQSVDNDRIDVAVFNKDVNILRHAIPFSKDLLLSSDTNQFRMSYQGALAATAIQIEYTTSFNVSGSVRPINMGGSAYFVDDKQGYEYSRVLEYYVKDNQTGDDVDDITEAVPEYIPSNLRFLSASPRMKLLICNSFQSPNKLYVFKYYWVNDKKVQNAWGVWEFEDCDVIHWAGFLNNYLYMIIQRPSGLHLEAIQVDENIFRNAETVNPLLDRRVPKDALTLAYNATTDLTTVTLPYSTSVTPECIVTDAEVDSNRMAVTKVNGTTFTVEGDITGATAVYAGIGYNFRYKFSQQYMRKQTREGQGLVLEGRLQLRYLTLEYHNTAYFQFTVSTPGRDPVTTVFEGRVVGSALSLLGKPSFASGNKRIPMMANAQSVELVISNDSPYACAFGAAEWQAIYTQQSVRLN